MCTHPCTLTWPDLFYFVIPKAHCDMKEVMQFRQRVFSLCKMKVEFDLSKFEWARMLERCR